MIRREVFDQAEQIPALRAALAVAVALALACGGGGGVWRSGPFGAAASAPFAAIPPSPVRKVVHNLIVHNLSVIGPGPDAAGRGRRAGAASLSSRAALPGCSPGLLSRAALPGCSPGLLSRAGPLSWAAFPGVAALKGRRCTHRRRLGPIGPLLGLIASPTSA
ncbi:hypothetical protein GCM10010435_15240 [Winogradskya consettensis]|uniref:Uncharacterized protein n=1 Tax=Winogradskya consettensis TaxID=113560 RepID=A0A919VKB4_9ACTN|nr:hypothetical protein Aco04nite_14520 [Actinoplanes consettensis]